VGCPLYGRDGVMRKHCKTLLSLRSVGGKTLTDRRGFVAQNGANFKVNPSKSK